MPCLRINSAFHLWRRRSRRTVLNDELQEKRRQIENDGLVANILSCFLYECEGKDCESPATLEYREAEEGSSF